MESSKRIFVVLSTILFLEASAFNYYSTLPSNIPINYPGIKPGSPQAPTTNLGNQPVPLQAPTNYLGNQQGSPQAPTNYLGNQPVPPQVHTNYLGIQPVPPQVHTNYLGNQPVPPQVSTNYLGNQPVPPQVSTNYLGNQPVPPQVNFLNNGPAPPTGTIGQISNQQTNYNNNNKLASYQSGNGPPPNSGFSSGLGSTQISNSNSAQISNQQTNYNNNNKLASYQSGNGPPANSGFSSGIGSTQISNSNSAQISNQQTNYNNNNKLASYQSGNGPPANSGFSSGIGSTQISNSNSAQISNQQTNYNNNNKLASYQSGNGPPANSGFSSGIGSTQISNSNSAYGLTINGGSKNVYGPNHSDLSSAFGSNSNAGTSDNFRYPLPLSTTPQTQPLLTTNTQLVHNYNGLSSNPTATGIYSSQNQDKVKIVDVPINLGFGLSQAIKLPIAGNAKYKVMHVTPPESIPANVLPTIARAEADVQKILESERYNIGSYQSNEPQLTSTSGNVNQVVANRGGGNPNQNGDKTPFAFYNSMNNLPNNVINTIEQAELKLNGVLSDNQKDTTSTVAGVQGNLFNNGYNYPATYNLFNYNQPYGISDSQAQVSATSRTEKQDENMIPNNLFKTITQADLELKKILIENEKVKDNQQDLPQNISATTTTSTTSSSGTGAQYGNLYNSGLRYPATTTLYNDNQSYGNSHVMPLSYNNAQSSATSSAINRDSYKGNFLNSNTNILTNKEYNVLPNNMLNTLSQADSKFKDVLGDGDNQKSVTSPVAGVQYDNLFKNGYNYPATNNFYNLNQPYVTSNSQAQASATSSTVKQDESHIYDINNKKMIPNNLIKTPTQTYLEKAKDNQQDLPQKISATSTSTTSLTETGSQYGNLYNNKAHYPATSTLYNYNQPSGSSYETPLSYSNAQASANSGAIKHDGHNENDLKYTNIISNKEISALTQTKEAVDSTKRGDMKDNELNVQSNTFASTSSSSTTSAGGQYGQLSINNNGYYYPRPSTSPTYNQHYGYGNLGQLTFSSNSQAVASATAGSTTQNELGNYYYPTPKPADLTGINQPQPIYTPVTQYNASNFYVDDSAQTESSKDGTITKMDTWKDFENVDRGPSKPVTTSKVQSTEVATSQSESTNSHQATINHVPNKYNNNNNYNPQDGNDSTFPNWQTYLNQPTSISPQSTEASVVANNLSSLENVQDSTNSYIQTNYGLSYPVNNAPSSVGTQQSSTNTDGGNYDWKHHGNSGDDLSNGSTDTTQTTATASSNSESFSPPLSTFNFPSYNYNSYPQQKIIYEQSYGYQPSTTYSPIDEHTVPTILENEQDSTSSVTQNDSSNSESTATAEATAGSSQTVTTSSQQPISNQGHYPLYGQRYEYQPHLMQPTYAPVGKVTNNPNGNGNEQGAVLSGRQTNNESNNPTNNIPLYSTVDGTQTPSDNTNDGILYGGNYDKYYSAYGPYNGDQYNNNQPLTTDSPVDEHTISNYPTSLWNYGSNSSVIDDKNNKTQNVVDYGNEDKEVKVPEVDITNDYSSGSIANSELENINYNNQPSGLNHHRYFNRKNHPRYPHRNWQKYGQPLNLIHPKLPNKPDNQYDIPHYLTSLGDKKESSVSYSETRYESSEATNNVPLSNKNDDTQTSSKDSANDSTQDLVVGNEPSEDSSYSTDVAQSTAVTNSQSESNIELINSYPGYDTDSNNYPFKNQPISNSQNNYGDNSLNNQNTLFNYPYYNNGNKLLNDGDNNQQNTNSPNNADYSLINQVINNNDETTQNPTTTDANNENNDYSETFTKNSELSIETDKTEQTEIDNNNDKITEVDSSSSSTVIQDTVIKTQGQSSALYDSKKSGFSNIAISLNTKPDGTPYSRAFEALLKILDSIEKLFGNPIPKIPNTK